MKSLVFDSGPIISLTTNNLLWLLEPLQVKFGGLFYMPESVKRELVDRPLSIKKFEFEALQVQQYISGNILKVMGNDGTKELTMHLLNLANNCFSAKNHNINIVHYADMSVVAAAKLLKSNAIVIDERTTRELIEQPESVAALMERKLHEPITTDKRNLGALKEELAGIKVIRSAELAAIAYERGLLDRYTRTGEEKVIPNLRKTLLDSVLWGVKLDGCAISEAEIERVLKLEKL